MISIMRSAGVDFFAGEGLATRMGSLTEAGQRGGGRDCGSFLTQDGFQALNDEVLDRCAAACGGDFGSLGNAVREISRRVRVAINT
jgi:hypothetical protein